jgi:hypothetical protein
VAVLSGRPLRVLERLGVRKAPENPGKVRLVLKMGAERLDS